MAFDDQSVESKNNKGKKKKMVQMVYPGSLGNDSFLEQNLAKS